MPRWSVALACLVALSGACRRRGRARRDPPERDPRVANATRCADPRFVTAPSLALPLGPTPPVTHPSLAAQRDLRLVVGSTPEGVLVLAPSAGAPTVLRGAPVGRASVVATGRGFTLAWAVEGAGLLLARVGPTGAQEGALTVAGPAGARSPRLAWSGRALALAYLTGEGADARGFVRVMDPLGKGVTTVSLDGGRAVTSVDVAWARDRFSVAWGAGGALRYASLSPSGRVAPPVEVVAAGAEVRGVSVAYGARRVAIAWSDEHTRAEALYSTAVDLRGRRPDEPQRLSIRYAPGATASMAWDGGAFGVTWWEPVGGGAPRSYLAFLDRNGRRIGTQMRVYTDTPASESALAWTGRGYLVAFSRGDGSVEVRYTGPRGCDVGL